MPDMSDLDGKYFLTPDTFNCPFCNRRSVRFRPESHVRFDWSEDKPCYAWVMRCYGCEGMSLHLTYDYLSTSYSDKVFHPTKNNIDSHFFYSVPTAFFAVDKRVPRKIRELMSEADGCRKMNFLVGGSACARKAIYEMLLDRGAQGDDYDEKLKDFRGKHPSVDPELLEVLGHIKSVTSVQLHENSWAAWDSGKLLLVLEALKAVQHEVYVVPAERKRRVQEIRVLKQPDNDSQSHSPTDTE